MFRYFFYVRIICYVLTMFCLSVFPSEADVITGTGHSMKNHLGQGAYLNKNTSLKREWVIVNDEHIPALISDFRNGVNIGYDSKKDYFTYKATYEISVKESLSAIEIRIIPFNIWGEKIRNLSATIIRDFKVGTHVFNPTWQAYDHNAHEFYAALIYIVQVKLASGKIIKANSEQIVEVAQKFSDDFTEGDLQKDEDN